MVVQKLESLPTLVKRKRVCGYARVSSGKDAMLHSLASQVSYYTNYIKKNKTWRYVGVYSDEDFTGTKLERLGFQKMLNECRNGNIDLILTKSLSRFARNTVHLLQTIRELRSIGVDVYFEQERIHSLSTAGELLISVLASCAEEESKNVSENCKWRIRKNFKNGLAWNGTMLGYKFNKGVYEVIPSEAEIVKEIFNRYLKGEGLVTIAKALNEKGIKTKQGNPWRFQCVKLILKNYTYTGNLLLQKTYKDNHLNKRKVFNKGELPQYHCEGTHEAIISLQDFNKVQEIMNHRNATLRNKTKPPKRIFTGIMFCSICGEKYKRKIARNKFVWICPTYDYQGKDKCGSRAVPESELIRLTKEVLNIDELARDLVLGSIDRITVNSPNELIYRLKNGQEIVKTWCYESRSKSWTDEMKELARERAIKQHQRSKELWQK